MGELDKTKLVENYVSFLAGSRRSVRLGAADAEAKANMVRFKFFAREGAVTRDAQTGRYRVDFNKMTRAIDALSARLLTIQGDGDYAAAEQLTSSMGRIGPTLAADLDRKSGV